MENKYTDEKNVQILIAILKAKGIKRVIASPGATNVTFVSSVQNDPYFNVFSSVDERSAAYMACGLANETGEPVVISCTGATSSRNYLPGLTEAYYRKLPVLAITSTQRLSRVGHHVAQVTDRSSFQNDVVRKSFTLPIINDNEDFWDCEVKVNKAVIELFRCGGGPVHINLPTQYSKNYNLKKLPYCRVINHITKKDRLPNLNGRIAVFVGAHKQFCSDEIDAIDSFCATNDAVVFCDHTSGYSGNYKVLYALVAGQEMFDLTLSKPDILIHIGEITGDYASLKIGGGEVWRVSEDGELRDTFRKISNVFEMDEKYFFLKYTKDQSVSKKNYYNECKSHLKDIRGKIPELPFSNVWLASRLAHLLPQNSVIHFGILNSLRTWNFYELHNSIRSTCNVGGFGIDGAMSTVLGASLVNDKQLYFLVLGDLAFFYDMNAIGNRHLGNNIRILVVNNGKGTEFRQYNHLAASLGDNADAYVSAAGHFGNKSPRLIKYYAEALGFKYITASGKEEFNSGVYKEFISPEVGDSPIIFEVFTDSEFESKALEEIQTIAKNSSKSAKMKAKELTKKIVGDKSIKVLKNIIKN